MWVCGCVSLGVGGCGYGCECMCLCVSYRLELATVFAALDRDRSGILDQNELQSAAGELKSMIDVEVSEEELAALLRQAGTRPISQVRSAYHTCTCTCVVDACAASRVCGCECLGVWVGIHVSPCVSMCVHRTSSS